MEIINGFKSGVRSGINNNGYVVYCRYGLPHLICLPINRPDDPLLNPALSHLKALNGYYAKQFFVNLHPALNSADIVSVLYQYVMQSPVALADYNQAELIELLSILTSQSKLLIIPLFE
ncbi:MAG: hypothetical protein ACTH4U_10290 [Pseudoalteromonas prydzensis]|uniref:Uncharacterized protein n=1 Tax=Pseudoalteromonas prydzensis TaxID=182141 RepID=A0A7V1CYL3_9GAMM|nr:hypothetical protein [Pseudoalteromonas prydzensis]MBE0458705.1 hypothetical protein [Pseudoalteromonas prydzensis]HEA16395.1 hypothetical protein [Pseudoalteromonas prydzensis]